MASLRSIPSARHSLMWARTRSCHFSGPENSSSSPGSPHGKNCATKATGSLVVIASSSRRLSLISSNSFALTVLGAQLRVDPVHVHRVLGASSVEVTRLYQIGLGRGRDVLPLRRVIEKIA